MIVKKDVMEKMGKEMGASARKVKDKVEDGLKNIGKKVGVEVVRREVKKDAEAILAGQKDIFATGVTLTYDYRKRALVKLYETIEKYEDEICEALHEDLGKSRSESYMTEIGLVKSEISFMLKHLRRFMKERKVKTPLAQYVSRSFEKYSPYGAVLIVSPWNYPFLLSIEPLVDAIAAGNTAVVKPSAYSAKTSEVIAKMIGECFPSDYVAVVTGGREENTQLFGLKFGYVFFTGSQAVGKEVLRRASENLIPVTLELGGKSPCIVDETANLRLAARRIVFGKFVNCGQTCVAPDYVYCPASIKGQLIEEIKREIVQQYGERPLENADYGKIINQKHFERLRGLIDEAKVAFGGEVDEESLRIAPTVMRNVEWSDAVMKEEIFGPILPVLTYRSVEEAMGRVRASGEPLALYIFSSDKGAIRAWKERVSFGGGCVNDTLIHLATSYMGFGGVGTSGMGAYHGRRGFETFSHCKSMVDKKTFLDLPMRYQPYSSRKDKLVRWFVR